MKVFLKDKLKETNFKKELLRKSFHIFLGIGLILIYIYLGKILAIAFYAVLLLLAIISDIIRLRIYIQYPLKRIAEALSRSYERTYIGAHTYFLAGVLISLILFDTQAFMMGVLVVTFVDPLIALTGILFDGVKFPYNREKNVIGSIVGCLIALAMGLEFFSLATSIIIAALVFLLDSLPIMVSDNFVYPIAISFVASIL